MPTIRFNLVHNARGRRLEIQAPSTLGLIWFADHSYSTVAVVPAV